MLFVCAHKFIVGCILYCILSSSHGTTSTPHWKGGERGGREGGGERERREARKGREIKKRKEKGERKMTEKHEGVKSNKTDIRY